MEAQLVQLARLLRLNGIGVAAGELADALAAAALVGVAARGDLEAALRATLVKRSADVATFDRLLEAQLAGRARLEAAAERALDAALGAALPVDADERRLLERALALAALGAGPLGAAALRGDAAALARGLGGALLRLDLARLAGAGGAFASRRLLAAAGGADLARALDAGAAAVAALPLDPDRRERLADGVRRRLDAVEDAARALAESTLRAWAEGARPDRLPAPGAAVPAAEAARLELAVRRLARRLAGRLRRRDRERGRGPLALRATLRRNLGLDGIPAHLVRRRRRPPRPELVVLCDLSDSMRPVTRLMLAFLLALHRAAARVRTFAFVAEVREVTRALSDGGAGPEAIDRALAEARELGAGNSDYGQALRTFHDLHAAAVTRRATLLVIGDGRSNGAPPAAWALDALRRRARRLLWICPEPRARWGQGDSEMARYAARCDRVAIVTSLAELERLPETLVPRALTRGGLLP